MKDLQTEAHQRGFDVIPEIELLPLTESIMLEIKKISFILRTMQRKNNLILSPI